MTEPHDDSALPVADGGGGGVPMAYVWVVFVALREDCERGRDYEIYGVLSREDAAITYARDCVQREVAKGNGYADAVIERHALDPGMGEQAPYPYTLVESSEAEHAA